MKLPAFGVLAALFLGIAPVVFAQAPPTGSIPGIIFYSRGIQPEGTDGTVNIAAGDGSFDIAIANGELPRISPDGNYIVFHRDNATFSRANTYVRNLGAGTEQLVFTNTDFQVLYSFSLDSAKIFFDFSCSIEVMNPDGSGQTTLSSADCFDDDPTVNPATGNLAFHNDNVGIGLMDSTGANRRFVPNTVPHDILPAWTADGLWIAFLRNGASPNNWWKIHPDGTGLTQLTFLTNAADTFLPDPQNTGAAWVPDGSQLVVAATIGGINGLYAVAGDGSGTMIQIPTASGTTIGFVGAVLGGAVAVPNADLAVAGSVSPPSAIQGTNFTYVFSIMNNGPAVSTGSTFTDTLPAGSNAVSATVVNDVSPDASCAIGAVPVGGGGQAISCSVGSLPVNVSATVTIVATLNIGGNIGNTGSVTGFDADFVPANNSVTVPVTVMSPVSVFPTSVTLLTGTTQQFTASVTGVSNTSVTWSATLGSIDTNGLYTATSQGLATITATSVEDPTKSASAMVSVIFVATPTLVADYQFANVYTSSVGEDPALVGIGSGTNAFAADTVRGASQTVLVFPAGNGLQLSPTTGVFANAVYTIAALVRLDSISGYGRILDFKNASSDTGLYNLNGSLVFFDVAGGSSGPIAAGAYAHVVLTRAVDGTVTDYVNGVQQFTFADSSNLAVIDSANVLRFFKDDNATPNENTSGAVARIRIWNGALTAAQVAALEAAASADLSVSAVPVGGSAAVITIANHGPSGATNVVFTDTLDRFGFVSATPSQGGPCTFASSVVTCPLGAIAAGASATVTMVVTAPNQGWAAQVLKATSDVPDPNPTNNAARIGPPLSSFNTPTGANVEVPASDASGDTVTVSFASVTRVGSTTLSVSAAAAAPAGFRFGTPAAIYDISSNAEFAGPIAIALRFNPASFHHPAKVRLFHLENGFWVDRTTAVNLSAASVSAVTSSLSPFVLVEPLNNPPVANGGPPQALAGLSATGAAVKLDATSSSDADSDALTYRWTGPFPEGNGVVTGATPAVTMPLGASNVSLVVNDGETDSAPAAVSVIVSDFLVAANSAAASVKRGQSAALTVAVSPRFAAYGVAVALSCPNLPSGITCSFSPASITPGSNGANATLTITASATARLSSPSGVILARASDLPRRARPLFASWFASLAPFGLVWTAGLKRRRSAVMLALMLLVLIVLVACGGGGMNNTASSQPSPPASTSTVTITVTGTSSSLQHSTTVPVTLQ